MAIDKKIKPLKTPVSVTANQLLKGLSVYLKTDGSWSDDIADSAIAHNRKQETALLELADITVKSQYVLGAYSFPVEIKDGQAAPISTREVIRASRLPTIVPVGLTEKPEWQNEFTAANANSYKH